MGEEVGTGGGEKGSAQVLMSQEKNEEGQAPAQTEAAGAACTVLWEAELLLHPIQAHSADPSPAAKCCSNRTL